MESSKEKKTEEHKMETENENEQMDYYVLEKYEPETIKISQEDQNLAKLEMDLNLLKPYHYDNYFDEFQNYVQERNDDSFHNEDSNFFSVFFFFFFNNF